MILQVAGAFAAVVAASITFGVSKRFLVYSGFTGAFSWFVYLLLLDKGFGELMGVFVATLVSALLSHIFARILKAPVTVFQIPAILPTVPGVAMYRTVYYMLVGEREMSSFYLTQALQIAGMIAIGIFIMDTIFRMFVKNNYSGGKHGEKNLCDRR